MLLLCWIGICLLFNSKGVVVFCSMFLCKRAAQFLSNVHVSFVFRSRSAVQIFVVFVNFSNVHVCFLIGYRIAVQLFWLVP